jgi:hypothetical protein
MIETQFVTPVFIDIGEFAGKNIEAHEISRLINAALVDLVFCDLLLTKPSIALAQGYNGESFDLSPKAKEFVLTHKALSLHDFATSWLTLNTS